MTPDLDAIEARIAADPAAKAMMMRTTDLAALLAELRATTADLAVAVEVARERGEATADLRAGIETLRDELNDAMIAANQAGNDPWYRWASNMFDALDALLRGA